MRQAIEEKFILDVLQNYTTYKLAFRLAHNGKEYDDKEVERSAALKGIMGWVRLHPYNISQKVQVVVEHFRENVAPLLNGRPRRWWWWAAGMEAVRWQIAIDKYIKERGYGIGDAGGVLRRGEGQGIRPRPVHRDQQGAESQPEGPRHPRGVQHATSIRSCWWRTSFRPASISRCCAACTSISGWRASRPCRRCPA